MSKADCPVAVFDSGVGGISVLKELVAEMPHEDFRYYGDSAHAPYGTKEVSEVVALSDAIVKKMIDEGAKAVVIACNTATSAAADILRDKYSEIPIIGIEPALKPAVLAKKGSRVLVMATPVTLRLKKFHRLKEQFGHDSEIIMLPCPGLMERVEMGETDTPETEAFLRRLLAEYISEDEAEPKVDSVVLGCTHYPFVRPLIRKILGDRVMIFDGAKGTARELHRRLQENNLCSTNPSAGRVTFENSREEEEELRLCKRLFEI